MLLKKQVVPLDFSELKSIPSLCRWAIQTPASLLKAGFSWAPWLSGPWFSCSMFTNKGLGKGRSKTPHGQAYIYFLAVFTCCALHHALIVSTNHTTCSLPPFPVFDRAEVFSDTLMLPCFRLYAGHLLWVVWRVLGKPLCLLFNRPSPKKFTSELSLLCSAPIWVQRKKKKLKLHWSLPA